MTPTTTALKIATVTKTLPDSLEKMPASLATAVTAMTFCHLAFIDRHDASPPCCPRRLPRRLLDRDGDQDAVGLAGEDVRFSVDCCDRDDLLSPCLLLTATTPARPAVHDAYYDGFLDRDGDRDAAGLAGEDVRFSGDCCARDDLLSPCLFLTATTPARAAVHDAYYDGF